MRTVASWTLATLYSRTIETIRHISSVVTWKHILYLTLLNLPVHTENPDYSMFSEAHRVQVQDDFPRLGLHFLYDPVALDGVGPQTEAAQQTHLHDGHARRIQTHLLWQTATQPNVSDLLHRIRANLIYWCRNLTRLYLGHTGAETEKLNSNKRTTENKLIWKLYNKLHLYSIF